MNVENFKAGKSDKISNLIMTTNLKLSYNEIKKIIRNKDVKINGKRVAEDIVVNLGDEITFYYTPKVENPAQLEYEDENILVACKPCGIESVSAGQEDFITLLERQIGKKLFAVHRLDRNTEGLIVFAKNEDAKYALDMAFKNRTIEKYYLALVVGKPLKAAETLTAYLKKIGKESRVVISNFPQKLYEKIETRYKICSFNENFSLLEVELLTGKTHQIRAHLAHIGYPILGDSKYGNMRVNRQFKVRYQCLCSYKIVFHFESGSFLDYLDKKEIKLNNSKIDFLKFI